MSDTLAVEFVLCLFHGEEDWSDSAAAVSDLLRASVKINERYLQSHPKTPSPFEAGIRYLHAHANSAQETFRSIPEILRSGGSDCDGLVPYVVAWRRVRGNDPKADIFLQWKRGIEPGTLRYHVLEKRGFDGAIADPCRFFGM